MELKTQRISSGDESTISVMHRMNGSAPSFRCFVLEDQYNVPKVKGETRIPPGRYQIKLRTEGGMHQRYTEKFDWHRGMLWLQDVPEFEWVYIHFGNYEYQTDGCLLVGDGAQSNVIEDGMVQSSVAAYTRLAQEVYAAIDAGEEVWITIEDYA